MPFSRLTVGLEDKHIIDCDDPRFASDVKSDCINSSFILLLCKKNVLDHVRVLSYCSKSRRDVAITRDTLQDIVPRGIAIAPQSSIWVHVRELLESVNTILKVLYVASSCFILCGAILIKQSMAIECLIFIFASSFDYFFEVCGSLLDPGNRMRTIPMLKERVSKE